MKSTNKIRRLVMTATLATAVVAPGTAVASSAAGESGWVRFGHFAPSATPVDLLVDDVVAASGVAFKTVSDYMSVPAGPHRFAIRPTAQPDAPIVLEVEAGVPPNGAVTIGAVTTRDGIAAQVYDDVLTPPPDGASLVRFIHAAPDVASVDIAVANGPTLAAAVSYPGATAYLPVAAGVYDIDVRAAGTSTVLLHIAGWSIAAGVQSSVILIRGLDGNLDVAPVVDAAAASLPPVGGVATGFGGMSPGPESPLSLSMLLVPLVLVVSALALIVNRRVRRGRVAKALP